MRAGLHTWSFRRKFRDDPDFDIYKAVDQAAEMGFGAIEMMIGHGTDPKVEGGLPDIRPATVAKVTQYARDRGVDVLSYSTYNDFGWPEDDLRQRHIRFIQEWLKLAADNGVPNIRFLTGYYREGQDPKWQEERTMAGIEEVVPSAIEAGVNLSTENHNSIFHSADDLLMLIKRFGSPPFTGCPDPTNWCRKYFDASQEDRDVIYGELEKLAPYSTQSHLKLKGVKDDRDFVGYDLRRILRIYRDAGYRGAICFESIVYDNDEPGDLTEVLPRAREVLERAISEVLAEKRQERA